MQEQKLDRIIQELESIKSHLETLDGNLIQLMGVVAVASNPSRDDKEIREILERGQAIADKVLKGE